MFDTAVDVPEWDEDAWIDQLIVKDPGDSRPAEVIDALAPVEDLPSPRSVAEILRDAEHGPMSPAVFAELHRLDADGLSDDEQVAVMVAWQRYEAHCVGQKLSAIAGFVGPVPRDDTSVAAFAWTEIGAALRVGEGTGRALTHDARHLTTHLPATLAALRAGRITWAKTRTLIDASASLTPEQCAALEDRVLPKAWDRSPANHTRAVRNAVDRIDPDGADARREAKKRDIALIRYDHGDGVADLLLRALDSLHAEVIWTAADTWARHQKATGDTRTLDALRCAALVDWATRYLTGQHTSGDSGGAAPTRNGAPAVVDVIIGLPELIAGDGSGRLAATGDPVPADAIAALLEDGAKIRFLLTDTTGNLVGISTGLHDPPSVMRAYVALRDLTARTPTGSSTPVAGQDLDHIDPHGPTAPANLHAPTRGWHRAKTFRHWHVVANPDRTITWTSQRTGRTYTTEPFNYRDGP